MANSVPDSINCLADFCAKKTIPSLSCDSVSTYLGGRKADIAVLFGGTILAGADLFASAMRHHLAKKYIIVGGHGHTTDKLLATVKQLEIFGDMTPTSEAEVLNAYLKSSYNLQADFLETHSTNCGNNVTYLVSLIKEKKLAHNSILFLQDATMQRRMSLTLQHYLPDTTLLSYPGYSVEVVNTKNALMYKETPKGMWTMDRYISLLLGEIPRLRDDKEGYGPNGKNFLAHCEIPKEVELAFQEVKAHFPDSVRQANPNFASY